MRKSTFFTWVVIIEFISLILFSRPALANEAIWIEGENYTTTTFVEKSGAGSWYHNDKVMKDLLSPGQPGISDGDWHSHYTSNNHQDSGIASYAFRIAEGGSYSWWIRLNPFRNSNGGADYSYSLDDSPWQEIDLSYVTNRIDLIDPGIDAVHGQHIGAVGIALRLQPVQHQELAVLIDDVVDLRNQGADHLADKHNSSS